MMKIDKHSLSKLLKHNRKLGIKRFLKSIGYERTAELPYIIHFLKDRYKDNEQYLDIGSGDSPLPTYFLVNTQWDITCLDKFSWVHQQENYIKKVSNNIVDDRKRFHVVLENIFEHTKQYDIVSSVSVIEHFDDNTDIEAMKHIASLLKPGGIFILTTLINENYPKDFYKKNAVYGEQKQDKTFYQRHYDVAGINTRLIKPSGLVEESRIYFGEYGFSFGEWFIFPQWKKNPFKLFYKWLSPYFASHFVRYSNEPISDSNMSIDTASGIILVLRKKDREISDSH